MEFLKYILAVLLYIIGFFISYFIFARIITKERQYKEITDEERWFMVAISFCSWISVIISLCILVIPFLAKKGEKILVFLEPKPTTKK